MAYDVQTDVYQGPFDLLLHLILSQEVELYEVSLSLIIDSYLAELDRLEDLDLNVATEFLLIAATLVELKTRRLLPEDTDGDLDDELALWEERDLLLARLVECKTFKEAARSLSALADGAARSHPRTMGLEDQFLDLAPDLLVGITPDHLRSAFMRAIQPPVTPRIDLEHLAPARLSVTEAVQELMDELPRAGVITFQSLTGALVERLEVVVRFLAVLELYKQGMIDLDQPRTFGELTITWTGGDVDAEDASVLAGIAARVDTYEG